jgi:hypothetical protein
MSLSNDAAVSNAEASLLINENANQLTVTDELVLVKQQLAQLVRSVDALNTRLMPASLQHKQYQQQHQTVNLSSLSSLGLDVLLYQYLHRMEYLIQSLASLALVNTTM